MKTRLSRRLQGQSSLLRAPRYIERSFAIAGLLLAGGVAVITAGVLVGEVAGTVIASFGAILVTVALLSVVYDGYLKDVLIGEIFDALGIQQSLQAIDVREILRKDQVTVSEVLEEAEEIAVLPLDPISWLLQDWDRIAAKAAEGSIPVTIYLPSHQGPHIEVLAQRLKVVQGELESQIARLPDQLAESWDQKQAGHRGSSLQIILFEAVPTIGVLKTGQKILLEIPPSLGFPMADRNTAAIVIGGNGWSPWLEEFVSNQFRQDRIPAYSQSVMRPLTGSTSPDAPPMLEADDHLGDGNNGKDVE